MFWKNFKAEFKKNGRQLIIPSIVLAGALVGLFIAKYW